MKGIRKKGNVHKEEGRPTIPRRIKRELQKAPF